MLEKIYAGTIVAQTISVPHTPVVTSIRIKWVADAKVHRPEVRTKAHSHTHTRTEEGNEVTTNKMNNTISIDVVGHTTSNRHNG